MRRLEARAGFRGPCRACGGHGAVCVEWPNGGATTDGCPQCGRKRLITVVYENRWQAIAASHAERSTAESAAGTGADVEHDFRVPATPVLRAQSIAVKPRDDSATTQTPTP